MNIRKLHKRLVIYIYPFILLTPIFVMLIFITLSAPGCDGGGGGVLT
jgi:hypothetical protein